MTAEALNSPSYCEIQVRANDRDRYLLTLAAGRGKTNPDLFPLFAFNYEIAKTREVVSEPTLGLIRLQWWRDALGAYYAERPVPRHEVLDALVPVIKQHGLPENMFMALLEARETDLDKDPPMTVDALLAYAGGTVTPLNTLALRILGQQEESQVIGDISTAYALTGLLRAVPYHAAQGRLYLPADLMAACGSTLQDMQKDHAVPVPVTEEILALASGFLQTRPKTRFLKATRRLTETYIKRIRAYGVYDDRLHRPPVNFMLRTLLGIF
jgi:NADH dehydrogenase [ubiquinone] 1 alpha subcomplex assembly factor 6